MATVTPHKAEACTASDPARQVEQIVGQFNAGDEAALARLTPALIRAADARMVLRRTLVRSLTQARAHAQAEQLLRAIIAVYPEATDEKLLLAGALSRLGRVREAITLVDELALMSPTDLRILTSRLQFYLQDGRASEAAQMADAFPDWPELPPRLAHLALLALNRAGAAERAMDLVRAYSGEMTSDIAALSVAAALAAGDAGEGIRIGKQALARGLDGAPLRAELGRACLATLDYEAAIEHLTAAAGRNPKDVRTLAVLGEALVIKGRPNAALNYLEPAVAAAPHLVHVRAVYARALKGTRDYDGAARELGRIVELDPEVHQWKRQAAAALNQAGRRDEASRLFEQVIRQREAALPGCFQEGLDSLWEKAGDLSLPKARVDWAWQLRGGDFAEGRKAWERRANWGYLADRLIYDWLECRTDKAEEAMRRLADLTGSSELLDAAMAEGRGLILASAHIGPMFAGPLALELMSFRSKWMASTPSITGASYADALISTSDQTEAQVVRQAVQALDDGYAVAIAVDGAMSMASPRILFEGQEITYSAFAARLAYRRGAASMFAAPQWRAGRLAFHLAPLPDPRPGETMEEFSGRWRGAYLTEMRVLISGEPENLRLSGGLWRHIRGAA